MKIICFIDSQSIHLVLDMRAKGLLLWWSTESCSLTLIKLINVGAILLIRSLASSSSICFPYISTLCCSTRISSTATLAVFGERPVTTFSINDSKVQKSLTGCWSGLCSYLSWPLLTKDIICNAYLTQLIMCGSSPCLACHSLTKQPVTKMSHGNIVKMFSLLVQSHDISREHWCSCSFWRSYWQLLDSKRQNTHQHKTLIWAKVTERNWRLWAQLANEWALHQQKKQMPVAAFSLQGLVGARQESIPQHPDANECQDVWRMQGLAILACIGYQTEGLVQSISLMS